MSIQTEYWRSTLRGYSESRFYEQMLENFPRWKMRFTVKLLKHERISQLYTAFMNDHPELFFLPHAIRMRESFALGIVCSPFTEIMLDPLYSLSEFNCNSRRIDDISAELKRAAIGMNVYQKQKLICDYIIEHVTYGIDNRYRQDASAALVCGCAQCSGISRAVKLLCDRLGVKCAVVSGTAKNERGVTDSHAWNIVWIDGKACHFDVTFMLGANASKTKPYRYMFLNYSDEEMRATHSWDTSTVPKCVGDGRDHNEYTRSSRSATQAQPRSVSVGHRAEECAPISVAARALGVNENEIKDVIAPYELKYTVKSALKKGRSSVCINCLISADPARIIDMLNDAVRQALKESNTISTVAVSQCGTLYKFSW